MTAMAAMMRARTSAFAPARLEAVAVAPGVAGEDASEEGEEAT